MNDDWARLTRVRESQLATAREAVERERQAVQASRRAAEQALHGLQSQQAAKQALWQETVSTMAGGGQGVVALRQAQAWSGALDQRIAQAGQQVRAAERVVDERLSLLHRSRDELRRAHGELEKVKRMHSQVVADAQRVKERRVEDAVDELTSQAWLRGRAC